MLKLEAMLAGTRKRKQGKAHAALAQGKNLKAQKGTAASAATRIMPTAYMSSSESEPCEEVHFANYGQECD